jgi:plasmid stability protein
MGDLLVRNMPESLKQELNALAQRNGRSLSEETKRILQKGLAVVQEERAAAASDPYADFRREFDKSLLSDEDHQDMMAAIGDWKQESTPAKGSAAE